MSNPSNSPVCVNLQEVSPWDRSGMFINVLKHASPLGSADAPTDESVARQYPRQYPPVGVPFGFCAQIGNEPTAGTYLWTCQGRLASLSVSHAEVRNVTYTDGTGLTAAEVVVADLPDGNDMRGSLYVSVVPAPGVRVTDCKLLRPGYTSDAQVFTDEFLAALKPFGGVRCMDYFSTNESPLAEWADRPLPSDPCFGQSQSGDTHGNGHRGGPLEYALLLGQRVGKVWLNLPLMASDDYVTNFGKVLRDSDPSVVKIVEVGNEVWNTAAGFCKHAKWNYDQAVAEVAAGDDGLKFAGGSNNPGGTNPWYWSFARIAKRTAQVFQILKSLNVPNLRMVLCGPVANPEVIRVGLQYLADNWGPPPSILYAVGVAPYYGYTPFLDNDHLSTDALWGPWSYVDDAGTRHAGTNYLSEQAASTKSPGVLACLALARSFGLQLVAYETGTDASQYGKSEAAIVGAMHDPRMAQDTRDHLRYFNELGGREIFYYTLTYRYAAGATWGLTDTVRDLSKSQKYLGAAQAAGELTMTQQANQPSPALTATPQKDGTVTLAWDRATGTSYRVERGDTDAKNWVTLDNLVIPPYVDRTVPPASNVVYRVTPAAGGGPASALAWATTPAAAQAPTPAPQRQTMADATPSFTLNFPDGSSATYRRQ